MLNLLWPQATNGCKGQQGTCRHVFSGADVSHRHEAEGRAFSDNTTDTKLVAYSYRRWSTPAQNDGTSLARHTASAARWCSEHGYHLDTDLNLIDDGVSAYRRRNATEGALAAFLDACRSGRVAKGSVLLLENLDRLSRDVVRKAARTLEDICAEGVDVVDLSDGGRRYSLESLDSDPMQFIVMTMHFMARQVNVVSSPIGPCAAMFWFGAVAGLIGRISAPRYLIDLDAPICPMGPDRRPPRR